MNRKKAKLIILVCCILFTFLPAYAMAGTMQQISVKVTDGNSPGAGAVLCLYDIGKVNEDGSIVLIQGYSSYENEFKNTDNGSMEKLAMELEEVSSEPSMRQTADSNGQTVFGAERNHIYLLTGEAGSAKKIQPSIISTTGDINVRNINPKMYSTEIVSDMPEEDTPEGDVTVTETEEKDIKVTDRLLPQTGLLWWPAYVMFALGIIILIAGRKRNHE